MDFRVALLQKASNTTGNSRFGRAHDGLFSFVFALAYSIYLEGEREGSQ